jgi:hypothetical protein
MNVKTKVRGGGLVDRCGQPIKQQA